jgi:hypothetical protein
LVQVRVRVRDIGVLGPHDNNETEHFRNVYRMAQRRLGGDIAQMRNEKPMVDGERRTGTFACGDEG